MINFIPATSTYTNGAWSSATFATSLDNITGNGERWPVLPHLPYLDDSPRRLSRRERRMLAALRASKKGRAWLEVKLAREQRLADERKMADAIRARETAARLAARRSAVAEPERAASIATRAASLELR